MFNLKSAIIPTPIEVIDYEKTVEIAKLSSADFTFKYEGEGDVFDEAVALMKNIFSEKASVINPEGKYEITLKICDEDIKAEGYVIEINENCATLKAADAAGAYYAAATFEQIIHTDGISVLLPVCKISDYPAFPKRGHFLECRYGSDFLCFEDMKKGIDYFSKMKINKIVYGLYGCWGHHYDNCFAEYLYMPFEKYPQLKTPRNIKYYSAKEDKLIYKKDVLPTMFEENFFGKLAEYAKRKNIEVIPLINSLGHNSLLPRMFPEISAFDESGNHIGLGFCTNLDKTYEIMFSLYDEVIDKYLTPNGIKSFHIGLDEVWPMLGMDHSDMQKEVEPFCKCEKCRDREYGELMRDYIIKIAKHMQEKGIENLFVYDDMLRSRGILTKETADLFKKEGVWDIIVIDWWRYDMPDNVFEEYAPKVNDNFRSILKPMTGYFHWNLPTHMNPNIYAMTTLAEKNNAEGLVAYSSFEYCYDLSYRVFAESAWRGSEALPSEALVEKYAAKMFPENTGGAIEAINTTLQYTLGRFSRTNHIASFFEFYSYSNLRRGMEYPQDYPAKAYRRLRDEEDTYLPYLKDVYNKSLSAYKFFSENTSSKTGDIWKLISLQYLSQSDEFITIYNCNNLYGKGEIDEYQFLSELDRLIDSRKKTISLCEDVRIPANQYTCIRNMTITLQAMCDLRDHIKAEIKKGKKPEIDVFEFGKYLSDMSWFLR